MSQTTRCPACKTLFKVVPDQLRISEGWVRCGQCSEIFDAAFHLHQVPQVASPVHETTYPRVDTVVVAAETAVTTKLSAPLGFASQVDTKMGAEKPAMQEAPTGKPVAKKLVAEKLVAKESVIDESLEARSVVAEVLGTESENKLVPVVVPDQAPAVSFLRGGQQKSLWREPWVRVGLGFTALGLVAALALQVVVHERDRIAANVPDARPALAALCEILHCKVLPLRQIESVVIDSSTFSKLRGDAFRLAFTVKNASSIDLAMPALELTLTDSQDQPALRRVFLPSEFGATSNALAAGSEWVASVPIGVQPIAGAERITGYRILAFYP